MVVCCCGCFVGLSLCCGWILWEFSAHGCVGLRFSFWVWYLCGCLVRLEGFEALKKGKMNVARRQLSDILYRRQSELSVKRGAIGDSSLNGASSVTYFRDKSANFDIFQECRNIRQLPIGLKRFFVPHFCPLWLLITHMFHRKVSHA